MSKLDYWLDHYNSQHTTPGCKLSHLIGVPLIAISVPLFLFNWRLAWKLFGLGLVCQFVGHHYFERNKPVLFTEARNPYILLCALIYTHQGWYQLLRERKLVGKRALIGYLKDQNGDDTVAAT